MRSTRLFPVLGGLVCCVLWYPAAARADERDDLFERARAAVNQQDWDLAIQLNGQLLQLDPKLSGAYVNLAQAYLNKKEYDTAIGCCNTALTLNPSPNNEAAAYGNRAAAYFEKGDFNHADADFKLAVQANPNDATVWRRLGHLALRKDDQETAINYLKKAVEISPNFPMAYGDLAWILATCPKKELRDGRKAWEYAKKACELEPKQASHMDTLAAAFAECEDFAEAVQWEERAIEAATDESELKDYRDRLQLYQQEKPYRMETK